MEKPTRLLSGQRERHCDRRLSSPGIGSPTSMANNRSPDGPQRELVKLAARPLRHTGCLYDPSEPWEGRAARSAHFPSTGPCLWPKRRQFPAITGVAIARLERLQRRFGAGTGKTGPARDEPQPTAADGVCCSICAPNPGRAPGCIDQISIIFFPRPAVPSTATRGRHPGSVRLFEAARGEPWQKDCPIVVLINGNSASAV